MSTRARRLAVGGVAALAALAWLHLAWQTLRPTLALDHWRTPSYWVAPRLALDSRLDVLYDDEAFAAAAVELGAVPDIWMPNPPVALVPLLPLAGLDESAARNVVLALNLAAVLAAALLLGRAARLTALGWSVALLGLAVFQPLQHGVLWGQVYGVVLLAITVVALAGERRRGTVAGAVLGAAAALKYAFPLAAAAGLFVAGRVRAAAIAVAVLGAAVAASVVAWGPGPWQAWLAGLGTWADRPVHAVTALQMPRGLLTRLFERHAEHGPSPLVDAPVVGDLLFVALAAVVLAGTALAAWRCRRAGRPELAVAVAVVAALLVSPYVDDYAYVLALLPLAVAGMGLGLPGAVAEASGGRRATPTLGWAVLAASAVLLGAAIPFRDADPAGLESLLWYPRVYGALLLWGLLVALAVSPRLDGAGVRAPGGRARPGVGQGGAPA